MATKTKKAIKVAKKSNASKPINKKATLAKKPVQAKKLIVKKAIAKKSATIQPKKAAKKVVAPKKSASKLIKTPTPVKKAAKAGLKKAAPEKLTKAKKIAIPNPKVSAKKSAVKKEKIVSKKKVAPKVTKVVKPSKEISVKNTVTKGSPIEISAHKADLKKALATHKAKLKDEPKKAQKPFVMPKTHTEKARKYEPEFTKSVLDQSPYEDNGPSMRYSDNELIEFRELITRKLETAKKELGYLQGLITRKDQMGGDESDNRYMTMEDGSLSMEREQLSQMASRQITFIDHLEKAMMRIENKTYGICRVTGKLIDKARLRAVPHATLSIEAKMGIAK
ncbi:MAG TPA: TraR/DksA C4-type zinc finger protein [Hanamia sp.]